MINLKLCAICNNIDIVNIIFKWTQICHLLYRTMCICLPLIIKAQSYYKYNCHITREYLKSDLV